MSHIDRKEWKQTARLQGCLAVCVMVVTLSASLRADDAAPLRGVWAAMTGDGGVLLIEFRADGRVHVDLQLVDKPPQHSEFTCEVRGNQLLFPQDVDPAPSRFTLKHNRLTLIGGMFSDKGIQLTRLPPVAAQKSAFGQLSA